ncbi:MAG: hypothetical protein HYZ28_20520, partial [Myxococcales bacterium]|nr:hypothetical protein [Myxococcales bacterium]
SAEPEPAPEIPTLAAEPPGLSAEPEPSQEELPSIVLAPDLAEAAAALAAESRTSSLPPSLPGHSRGESELETSIEIHQPGPQPPLAQASFDPEAFTAPESAISAAEAGPEQAAAPLPLLDSAYADAEQQPTYAPPTSNLEPEFAPEPSPQPPPEPLQLRELAAEPPIPLVHEAGDLGFHSPAPEPPHALPLPLLEVAAEPPLAGPPPEDLAASGPALEAIGPAPEPPQLDSALDLGMPLADSEAAPTIEAPTIELSEDLVAPDTAGVPDLAPVDAYGSDQTEPELDLSTEMPPAAQDQPSPEQSEVPVIDLLESETEPQAEAPENVDLTGNPADAVPLASAADFLTYETASPDAPASVDGGQEDFGGLVESGPLADAAYQQMQPESVAPPPEDQVPLASAADFLSAPEVQSSGAGWGEPAAPEAELFDATPPEWAADQPPQAPEQPASDGWSNPTPTEPGAPAWETPPAVIIEEEQPAAEEPPEAQLIEEEIPAPPPAPPRLAPAAVPLARIPLKSVSKEELFDRGGLNLTGEAAQRKSFVEGEHRVIIHTVEGLVKRGTVRDIDLQEEVIPLENQAGGAPERIATSRVKAVFFMLQPGSRQPPTAGKKIRVTFIDGRQVAGFSSDFGNDEPGFFMVPADNRTNTARIYIFRSSVQTVAEG